jgi:Na+/H+-dicarboxylate symporter
LPCLHFGPELLEAYARAMILYYPLLILSFFITLTTYAFITNEGESVSRFWCNIIPASLVALAIGSSMATIPTNSETADKNLRA